MGNLVKWKKLEENGRATKVNIGNWELMAKSYTDFIKKIKMSTSIIYGHQN